MFRITATLIEGEDRVRVEIDKDDANAYEIGAVAMAVDDIVNKLLGEDNGQEEEDESDD